MNFPRAAGILLHITSLPSTFGIGDLGPSAFEFLDFLVRAKQKYWQILPLGQTGYGNSPYSCFSAFAGNIYLISPELLVADGLLSEGYELANDNPSQVNYEKAIGLKIPLLRIAFDAFRKTADERMIGEFHVFCDSNAFWLEDYSLYRAVMAANDHLPWNEWEDGLKDREPGELAEARHKLDEYIFAEKFYQFIFFRQWNALKRYANEKGIAIIGDVPIYVTADSCDVWCGRDQFKLDEEGKPKLVAGVPPDAFSDSGQLWGFPVYDWERMRNDGFKWWIRRLQFNLSMFDVVRIDHFIGFTRAWEIPAEDKTAVNGQWISVPGRDLFSTFKYVMGDVPLIAEDLGEVTPEVEELRDSFGIPGMRILEFAFGGDAKNLHLPHNYIPNSVVYTGTHDNETVVGWYTAQKKRQRSQPSDRTLDHCLQYLRTNGKDIHWEFIAGAFGSIADLAVIPMQDILGLDNTARMNLPATTGENWVWKCKRKDLSDEHAEKLFRLSELYGR